MAKVMIKLLDQLGAMEKTGHWIVNGATSNWTFLKALSVILNARGVEFDAWDMLKLYAEYIQLSE